MITVEKNRREVIRIERTDFKGHDIISLRVWFRSDDGERRPGKQGIAFRADLLPEVIDALKRMGSADGE